MTAQVLDGKATAAAINGAELIPDTAELFLGFTSTSKAALGPTRIANFETLGYVDVGPDGYFAQGTHMHLSHIFEDLPAWYQLFDFQQRVDTTFRPGLEIAVGTQTVAQGPSDVQDAQGIARAHADASGCRGRRRRAALEWFPISEDRKTRLNY